MDIRQLSYFISVAEHLSFTKAAEHHHIAQTAVSQQIMALEHQLGVKLFFRNNRSVRLTPAGNVFYREAKLIVARTEEAINKTRKAASGLDGYLRIGFVAPYRKIFLPELIRNFKRHYPGISLTFDQANVGKLREALEHELLDIAVISSYGIENTPGLVWKTLFKEPQCAVLYRSHPLAKEQKIRRTALANESFVAFDQREASFAFDGMIQDCVRSGFSPKIVEQSRFLETVLFLVEAEIGITLLPRCYESYAGNNLRFIELEGENEYHEYVVAWMRDNHNPAIPLFLKAIEDLQKQDKGIPTG
ncbi:MAG: LysR family transcriptional regulator [Peptococcaceae bacterium]|nr:LysR family transcriptional regulator [Peptococcaceae bacterium]